MQTENQSQTNSKKLVRDAAIQINGKKDLFQSITDRIIGVIEAGEATGSIKWAGQGAAGAMPVNLKTGKEYSGINVLLLWATAQGMGYTSNYWLTFNQTKALGGHVKKGAQATTGVFWGSREVGEEDDTGETVTRKAAFSKPFQVFNFDQVEGIAAPDAKPGNVWDAHATAEALIKATGAKIIERGARAFYRPSADEIHIPDRSRFESAENFYTVSLHELTHWTGHVDRCARDLTNRFGDEAYAMEELVAELGAAFLCAETGIHGRIEGHASYIESWLRILKSDPRAIVAAASKAGQAARFVIGGPEALRVAA